jgi:hypothetical protein
MIVSAATLMYDYPPEIVAPVGSPERLRPRVRYSIPQDAIPATSEHAGFAVHFAKLNKLAIDHSLWPNHAEPPSGFAMAWAQLILDQLQNDKLLPTRVVASAEGGVGVCFVDGIKYADIECLNSGTILGVTSDRSTRPVAWEVEQSAGGIARASERIREFIDAFKTETNAPERPRR